MLIGLLSKAEAALGLPVDVRAVVVHRVEDNGKVCGALGPGRSVTGGGERAVLLKEGLMVHLTDQRLYKSVREQARDLREKIAKVDVLLKGLDERQFTYESGRMLLL